MLPDPGGTLPAVLLLALLWAPAPGGRRNPVSTHLTSMGPEVPPAESGGGQVFVLVAEIL